MAHIVAKQLTQRLHVPVGISSRPSQLVKTRGFAADHHGPKKVNMWEDPTHPGNWKEEHFVFASLAGWGLVFYGAYRAFTGPSKKDKAPAEVSQEKSSKAAH